MQSFLWQSCFWRQETAARYTQKSLVMAVGIIFEGGVFFVLAAAGSVYPEHEAYGVGIGVMSGQVVWFYDKDSVNWDGSGYWWNTANYDENAIQNMVDQSIAGLAGKAQLLITLPIKQSKQRAYKIKSIQAGQSRKQ